MRAILIFIALGIAAGNLAAIVGGTRAGIAGMLTVDILSAIAVCVIGVIWIGRRRFGATKKTGNALSARAGDVVVDIGAMGLKLGRRISSNKKLLADRIRERAGPSGG